MTNPDTPAGGVKLEAKALAAAEAAYSRTCGGITEGRPMENAITAYCQTLAALPAAGATPDFDAALEAFIKSVREQDSEWTDDTDEGEVLLTSPSGDYFAPYYPLMASLTAAFASPPKPSEAMVERAARAMCVEHGYDADETMPNDGPRWKYYVPSARAALTAALSGGGE